MCICYDFGGPSAIVVHALHSVGLHEIVSRNKLWGPHCKRLWEALDGVPPGMCNLVVKLIVVLDQAHPTVLVHD